MKRQGSTKTRVAHVTLGLEMGGQEKLLVEFARHADRSRFDLHFIVLGRRGLLAEAIEECGWKVQALGIPDGLRPASILHLSNLLRRGSFDVVHSHDERPLVYAAPAARFARVPMIVHTHHHGRLTQVSPRQENLIALAARFVHRFVCVSHDSARYATSSGVPAAKTLVVHNGIDLDRFSYVGPNPRGPAVSVARLSPAKGMDVLVQAAALVKRSCPEFRLQIAGQGPCFFDLKQQIRNLGLEQSIELLGEVNNIPELLGHARMFILPSFSEGISLTLLESMARGLAVVATHVGGVPEVVVEGETGALAPAHDAEALAQAITPIWNDPERGRAWGAAARKRVEERFDVRRMIARYQDLYTQPVTEKAGLLETCTL